MIMLKTVTGQSISASLIHYLFGSAHGIALQYEQERILQASCLISLCVRILIFHAFHPLHLVMKHLKQLYWLFGTLSGLVGSFIHPYSPEEASVLMHQDMQLCGLLLHAHSCTKSPKTHAYTHTLSEAAGFAPRVGGDIICFHAILAQECPGTICLSVHPALSLFHMCVCVCVLVRVCVPHSKNIWASFLSFSRPRWAVIGALTLTPSPLTAETQQHLQQNWNIDSRRCCSARWEPGSSGLVLILIVTYTRCFSSC